MVAGRDRALLEPVTMHLLQPWFLNLVLRIPGKRSKIQVPRPDPDLMNWEAKLYIKNDRKQTSKQTPLADDLDV